MLSRWQRQTHSGELASKQEVKGKRIPAKTEQEWSMPGIPALKSCSLLEQQLKDEEQLSRLEGGQWMFRGRKANLIKV